MSLSDITIDGYPDQGEWDYETDYEDVVATSGIYLYDVETMVLTDCELKNMIDMNG